MYHRDTRPDTHLVTPQRTRPNSDQRERIADVARDLVVQPAEHGRAGLRRQHWQADERACRRAPGVSTGYRYSCYVTDAPRLITAEELDAMSPDERARVVREHVVTDLDQLPDDFRRRVETTAGRLAEQRRPTTE